MNGKRQSQDRVRVAAYIRVSTDSRDQENSYEAQNRYFGELLRENPGWIRVGIYSDYGVSGTGGENRTGYRRLLRHCREGKIDRILCKSISRFARNTADFMEALAIFRECRVTVLFEKEGLDTAKPGGDFILTALGAVAQEESRSISANVSWGIRKRFPKGQARNYRIYGYRFAEGPDSVEIHGDGYRVRALEVVEEEARVVRRIFRAADEGMGFAEIARMLNREGILPPNYGKAPRRKKRRGIPEAGPGPAVSPQSEADAVRKPASGTGAGAWPGAEVGLKQEAGSELGWTGEMVSGIAALERYCGDVLLQKTYTPDFLSHRSVRNCGELPRYLVRDHHPAIIERDLFQRVQEIKRSNSARFSNKSGKREGRTLTGRLICGACGRRFHVRNTSSHPIWFCPASASNNGKQICRAEKVYEEQIVRMLKCALTDRFHLQAERIAESSIMPGAGENGCRRAEDREDGRHKGRLGKSGCRADAGVLDAFRYIYEENAASFVSEMKERLERMQQSDFTERDREFLTRRIRMPSVPAEEKRKLEQHLEYLEDYWEDLEKDYEAREKALRWMDSLPAGRDGIGPFFKEVFPDHVRAFVISVTVQDPLHFSVRWFDDTRTDVEMDSNVGDFRCRAPGSGENVEEIRKKCGRNAEGTFLPQSVRVTAYENI